MTTKRAYKLQEFVAHASTVNCLKIGKRSSRVLVTGGEDHKVNLWAIGKPNAILSLSGHTSGIDSVGFDFSEVLVAAGAASGTIKLWNLEEAKIVRTLTGHRSNCISVDFHPFGEFFASGSLDTNLKIWDIRRRGCIHTYKGHTRGVNAIRFTPDGRWIVSGGEDNVVKLWDLTAGKLLHDFKCHEGQIQCIDFHPNEFLLATGSADRTVKFWDLETFELIGSAGPETSGVRCVTFNPDGRTLLCGLQESLKVFSWEPIRCHDSVDVGWSRLSDLNVHEGKLLGCSFNQSCVGVWVVDISRIEPYAINVAHLNGQPEAESPSIGNLTVLGDNTAKPALSRLSVSENPDPLVRETKSLARLSLSQNSDLTKDEKYASYGSNSLYPPAVSHYLFDELVKATGCLVGTPQRTTSNSAKMISVSSVAVPSTTISKRSSLKMHPSSAPVVNKLDIAPVIVPRNGMRSEMASSNSGKDIVTGRNALPSLQPKAPDLQKDLNSRDEVDKAVISVISESSNCKGTEMIAVANKIAVAGPLFLPSGISTSENAQKDDKHLRMGKNCVDPLQDHNIYESHGHKVDKDVFCFEGHKGGRSLLLMNLEKRERFLSHEVLAPDNSSGIISGGNLLPSNVVKQRGNHLSTKRDIVSMSDEDAISDVMEPHDRFLNSMQYRSTKLQVIYRYWERNDVKGVIGAMEKLDDHAVTADVVCVIMGKTDLITLEVCTGLLPLLARPLESEMDRHVGICLEMLLKLIRIFGSVIYSTLSASTSVGVDIEAEQRLERCNLCFVELEKVKRFLPSLMRKGSSVAKSAHELNLALQEVS